MSEETTEARAATRIGVWLARQKCVMVRVSEYGADVQLADIEMRAPDETAAEVAELICAVNENRGKFSLFALAKDGKKKDLVTVARFTVKLEPPATSANSSSSSREPLDLQTFIETLLSQIGSLTKTQTEAVGTLMTSFGTMLEAVNKRLALAERRANNAEEIARDATDLASSAASDVGREERRGKMWSMIESIAEAEIKERMGMKGAPIDVDAKASTSTNGGNGAAS